MSEFRFEPVGHVVTGNLGIVENRKLRKLHSKAIHIENETVLTGIPT